MTASGQNTKTISLKDYGITHENIDYQLSPAELQAITVENKMGVETANGTLAVNTGEFTGRSPMDRFIVEDSITKEKVWWARGAEKYQPLRVLKKQCQYINKWHFLLLCA